MGGIFRGQRQQSLSDLAAMDFSRSDCWAAVGSPCIWRRVSCEDVAVLPAALFMAVVGGCSPEDAFPVVCMAFFSGKRFTPRIKCGLFPDRPQVGGCRPGELSHSLMCDAVSARLALNSNSSRSGQGGSSLARSRSASACTRSLSSRGTVCLKRRRPVMTRSFPAQKPTPVLRSAR